MNNIKASVIIAFYNNLQFLKLVLAGFRRQSEKNFEILIADDGSSSSVTRELQGILPEYPFLIRHIWHDDKGWRKNVILNKAIKAAASDYLIFIDSDCIPHQHFVLEHLKNRDIGKILSGRRLNLSDRLTQNLTPQTVLEGYLERNTTRWLIKGLKGEFTHAEKGLYLPFLKPFLIRKKKELLGCNFSIHKSDFLRINGFDERYLAPTFGEDTDVEYRAGLAGIGIKSVRNLAIQYHLFHPKLSRENENHIIFKQTQKEKLSFTPYGIIKENGDELV
jgi:glycosyltransferase involved in cell wall biosynthesis